MKWTQIVGDDILVELSSGLYSSEYEVVREYLQNASDAITKYPAETTEKKILITYNEEIFCVEDWGSGLREDDITRFESFGKYKIRTKTGLQSGYKGLGKLAGLKIGTSVEMRTNNGLCGRFYKIVAKLTDNDSEVGEAEKFLNHRGSEIRILNPKLPASMSSLRKYLEWCFSLKILRQGIEIILNGTKLEPDPRFLFSKTIEETQYGIIEGSLVEDRKGRGEISVFVDELGVLQSLGIDPTRKAKGWINYNALTPSSSRNELDKNDVYTEMIQIMQKRMERFPKRNIDVDKRHLKTHKELLRRVSNALKDMNIIPKGLIPNDLGCQEVGDILDIKIEKPIDEQKEKHEKHEKHKHHKKGKNTISKWGMVLEKTDDEDDREPAYFIAPNRIAINMTNTITKFIHTKSDKEVLDELLIYVSRAMVKLKPDSGKLSSDDYNKEADNMMRKLLSI